MQVPRVDDAFSPSSGESVMRGSLRESGSVTNMYGSITLFCQENIGATAAEGGGGRRWEEVLQAPAHEEEVSCVHPSKLLFIESCGLCSARAFWAVSRACSRCSLGVQAGFFSTNSKHGGLELATNPQTPEIRLNTW